MPLGQPTSQEEINVSQLIALQFGGDTSTDVT